MRKAQHVGLTSNCKDDDDIRIRLHVRMCSALDRIPIVDVDEGWLIIIENTPEND